MSQSSNSDYAYMLREECGCVRTVVVDNRQAMRDAAKDIKRALDEGCHMERHPIDEAREILKTNMYWDCKCSEGNPCSCAVVEVVPKEQMALPEPSVEAVVTAL